MLKHYALTIVLLLLFASVSIGQECTTDTGYNSTLILPPGFTPTINGVAVADGTQIRIIASGGECVGELIYVSNGIRGQSTPIWGEDILFNPGSGASVDDSLSYQLKLPTSNTWRPAIASYTDGILNNTTGTYTHDRLYVLGALSVIASADSSSPGEDTTGLIAKNDIVTIGKNTAIEINVLANDDMPDGNITVKVVSAPASGTATVNDDNTITYTPDSDFIGKDSLAYEVEVSDSTSQAAVMITVNAANNTANHPPSAVNIVQPESGSVIILEVQTNDAVTFRAGINLQTTYYYESQTNNTVTFQWEKATDPNGDEVTYTWRLSASKDFSTLLMSKDIRGDTTITVTHAALFSQLKESGLNKTVVELYHQVVVSDGVDTVAGETATLTLKRGTTTDTAPDADLPKMFALKGNYPNPFNPSTTIPYAIPEASTVRLTVYNVRGQVVATLVNGRRAAGRYTVTWEAGNQPSGVYFYRLEAGSYIETRKLMLLK